MRPETEAVHAGLHRTQWEETAAALALTSGYNYATAAEAEAAFAGYEERYIYSRYGNPTVNMVEERLAVLEGAEVAQATGSGMGAVFLSLISHLESGDRVVASRALFGSCTVILEELLPRWGITTTFVDGTKLAQWEQALATPAKIVFFESVSNPMLEIVDVVAVAELARAAGAKVIVDNVFATPVLQKPLAQGADVVVYSTTKHFDGGGRTLGGAVLCDWVTKMETLNPFTRHTGPTMSPFTAWVLLNSIESLALRVERQTASAAELASRLEAHPKVRRVWYPTADSHPQHELARSQMTGGGTLLTLDVGDKDTAFGLLDAMRVISISNNLGDAKSLATHPASTTHRRLGPDGLASAGITAGVVRVSIGLEAVDDLWDDLDQALG